MSRAFDPLLSHMKSLESVLTTEQCPACRGSGRENSAAKYPDGPSGTVTRQCSKCCGKGRIAEKPETARSRKREKK